MRPTIHEREQNARLSLAGLSLGDAFGEQFFHPDAAAWLAIRQVPPGPWKFTDDTAMALSLVGQLLKHGRIKCDELAEAFAQRYTAEPWRGYGGGATQLLEQIAAGVDWRSAGRRLFNGTGSYGNGGAMRVAPVGAWFFEDFSRAADEARRSALVTHSHIEGQAGAVAIAVAAAFLSQVRIAGITPTRAEFFSSILENLPAGKVHRNVATAAELDDTDLPDAVSKLGNDSRISAQDTVGLTLWIAWRWRDSYSAALWQAASAGGDVDTVCAIVGGLVALSADQASIPADWLRAREALPQLG